MASGYDLRPRTVGELLDGSFFLYRRHFGRFLLLATIVSLPTLVMAGVTAEAAADVLRDAIQSSLDSIRHPKRDPIEAMSDQLAMNLHLQTYGLLSTLLQALSRGGAVAVMAVATSAAILREPVPGVRDTLRRAGPRIPAAVLAYAAQTTLAMPLMCCLPIGVIAMVVMMPVPAIVMFERGGVERALRHALPRGPLGLVIAAVTLPPAQVVDGMLRAIQLGWHALTIVRGTAYVFFVALFVGIFVAAVSTAVAALLDSSAAWFWLNHYAEVVFLPVVGISTTLWFVDLRVRREGLDITGEELVPA